MILIKDIVLALSGSQYTRKEKSIRHLYCENLLKKKKKDTLGCCYRNPREEHLTQTWGKGGVQVSFLEEVLPEFIVLDRQYILLT